MAPSDRPDASGMYVFSTDPQKMMESINRLARGYSYVTTVDKAHWGKILEIETAVHNQQIELLKLTKLTVELKAKMAVYAGIGAMAGGGIVGLIMKLAFGA